MSFFREVAKWREQRLFNPALPFTSILIGFTLGELAFTEEEFLLFEKSKIPKAGTQLSSHNANLL